MKIRSVKTHSQKWFDLLTVVPIKTQSGIRDCKRFYFNGFEPVFVLSISDGKEYSFTGNHQLLLNTGWTRVDLLKVGDIFGNGLLLNSVTNGGVKATMDMEVPYDHHYILDNGIVSHNTSFIMGNLSQGIEPIKSNFNEMDRAKVQVEYRNPELVKLLASKGMNTKEVWKSILHDNGSVQNLQGLTQEEKEVFKTFYEISQMDIINLAAQRQPYINMGQSINLMIHPKTPPKEVNKLVLHAYREGIKSLYYQYSISAAQEFNKELLNCSSCES